MWIRPFILSLPSSTSGLLPLSTALSTQACPDQTEREVLLWALQLASSVLGVQTLKPLPPACPAGRGEWKVPWSTFQCSVNAHWPGLSVPRDKVGKAHCLCWELKFYLVLETKPTPVKNPHSPKCVSVKRGLRLEKEQEGTFWVPEMFCMWVVVTGKFWNLWKN